MTATITKKPMTGTQAIKHDHDTVRRILERRAFKLREEDECRLPLRESFFRLDAAICELLAAIEEAEQLDLTFDETEHPLPVWQEVLDDADHLRYLATISRDFIRGTVPSSWGLYRQMKDPVESAEMVKMVTRDMNALETNEAEVDEPCVVAGRVAQ